MDHGDRAAIILAGGDGVRLADYIRMKCGLAIPKQFCAVVGEHPLVEQTRRRVECSVVPSRTFFVLNRDHERYFAPLLSETPAENLVLQPTNRGTAPAILWSLLRLAQSAGEPSVLLMPSDHYVGDEPALMRRVDDAFAAIDRQPHLTLLLGAAPDEPETSYGWIQPGSELSGSGQGIFRVRRFWEKPDRELAVRLMADGALWNSFIIVARLSTLLGLFALEAPALYEAFSKVRPSLGTAFEPEVMARLYRELPASDFSTDVLQRAPAGLCVLPMGEVGWSDLGEPRRVEKAMARMNLRREQAPSAERTAHRL